MPPKKKVEETPIGITLKGNPSEEVEKEFEKAFKGTENAGYILPPTFAKPQSLTAELFLNSKGIDPPIKEAPIQGITFVQLCELMTEFKNA